MRRTRHVVLPVRSWQYIGLMVVSLACLTLGLVSRDREGRSGSLAGPELMHTAPHEVDACPNDNPLAIRLFSDVDLATSKGSEPTSFRSIDTSISKNRLVRNGRNMKHRRGIDDTRRTRDVRAQENQRLMRIVDPRREQRFVRVEERRSISLDRRSIRNSRQARQERQADPSRLPQHRTSEERLARFSTDEERHVGFTKRISERRNVPSLEAREHRVSTDRRSSERRAVSLDRFSRLSSVRRSVPNSRVSSERREVSPTERHERSRDVQRILYSNSQDRLRMEPEVRRHRSSERRVFQESDSARRTRVNTERSAGHSEGRSNNERVLSRRERAVPSRTIDQRRTRSEDQLQSRRFIEQRAHEQKTSERVQQRRAVEDIRNRNSMKRRVQERRTLERVANRDSMERRIHERRSLERVDDRKTLERVLSRNSMERERTRRVTERRSAERMDTRNLVLSEEPRSTERQSRALERTRDRVDSRRLNSRSEDRRITERRQMQRTPEQFRRTRSTDDRRVRREVPWVDTLRQTERNIRNSRISASSERRAIRQESRTQERRNAERHDDNRRNQIYLATVPNLIDNKTIVFAGSYEILKQIFITILCTLYTASLFQQKTGFMRNTWTQLARILSW